MNNIRSVVLIIVALFFPHATTMEKDEEFEAEEDVWIQPRNGSLCSFKGKFINQCRQVATLAADLPVNTATCSRTDEENPIGIEIDNHTLALVMNGIEAAQENPFHTAIEGNKEIIEAFAYLDVDEKFHPLLLKSLAEKLLEIGVAAVESDVAWNSYCSSVKNIHPRFQQKLMALIWNTKNTNQLPYRAQRFQIPPCCLTGNKQRFNPALSNDESTLYLCTDHRLSEIHIFDCKNSELLRSINLPENLSPFGCSSWRELVINDDEILTIKDGHTMFQYNMSSKNSSHKSAGAIECTGCGLPSCSSYYLTTPVTQIGVQKREKCIKIALFDLTKNKKAITLDYTSDKEILCAALSNDGTTIALMEHSLQYPTTRYFSLWNVALNKQEKRIELPPMSPDRTGSYTIPYPHGRAAFVSFSPDSRYLATLVRFEPRIKNFEKTKSSNTSSPADLMGITLYHLASKAHVWVKEEAMHELDKLFVSNNGIVTVIGKFIQPFIEPPRGWAVRQYDMFNSGKKISSFRIQSPRSIYSFIANADDGHLSFCIQDGAHVCMWRLGESVEERKATFPITALVEYIRKSKKSDMSSTSESPTPIKKIYREEKSKKSDLWKLLKRHLDANKQNTSSVLCHCCKEFTQERGALSL